MKKHVKVGLVGLIAGLGLGAFSALADLEISAGVRVHAVADFYAPLTPYGSWVEVSSYGRCWHPAQVGVDWRPYENGEWVWTDCGWYWESDEPWSWACYHYGRWVFDPAYGWLWVPDVEWAPAWVYWRVAPDYIGWAPCPPTGVVLAPSLFMFVDVHHFHERVRPSTVIVNNQTIINRSTQITQINRETLNIGGTQQRVVVNRGPGIDPIQKATGKRITPTPIREVVSRTHVPSTLKLTEPPNTGRKPSRYQEQPAAPQREQSREQRQEFKEQQTAPQQRPREFQEQRPPEAPPQYEQRRNVPPPTPPVERASPPTGREKERVYPQRPPVQGPPAGRPVGPPPEKEKRPDKDQEHP